MAHIIVAQTRTSVLNERQPAEKKGRGARITFSYHLPVALRLGNEPWLARLCGLTGTAGNALVYCDFVATQSVNGQERQLLGVRTGVVNSAWVPVSVDAIPSTGTITVEATAPTATFGEAEAKGVTVAIELLPESKVYGATTGSH